MKRFLLLLLAAFLAMSHTQAQGSYVGLQLSGILSSGSVFPFAEVQVGGPVAENVELRLSGLPLVVVNLVQLDLLYTQGFAEALRGYAGGGADVLLSNDPLPSGLTFGVHATAGVEYRMGSLIGLFAEVQPIFTFEPEAERFLGKLALGVNVHF